MTNRIKLLSIVLAILPVFTFAQDSKWNLSGSVDVYGRLNFSTVQDVAPGTSFANLPGFALGFFNGVFSYEGEKVGFTADLVYGPRGQEAVFNEVGSSNILNQLYAYLNVSDKTTLTVGNFNTFLGYEVISPTGNFHYSTSYLFSYGPFSHTGIKLDNQLSDSVSFMIGAFNPTDVVDYNRTNVYTFGAQLGIKDQYLNLLGGDGILQFDFTGGISFGDSFSLGVNATIANYSDSEDIQSGFSGVALYPQVDFNEDSSLGLRFEYFSDDNDYTGVFGADKATNLSFTLTGSFGINDLTIKPELRLDSASEEIFLDSSDSYTDSLVSGVVAFIYAF